MSHQIKKIYKLYNDLDFKNTDEIETQNLLQCKNKGFESVQLDCDFTDISNIATPVPLLTGIDLEISNVLASASLILNDENFMCDDGYSEMPISPKWFNTEFDY